MKNINRLYTKEANLEMTDLVTSELGEGYICYDVVNTRGKQLIWSLERTKDNSVVAYSESKEEFLNNLKHLKINKRK